MRVQVEGHGEIDVAEGTSLLEACEALGCGIEAACGGFAACNTCRVAVLGGAGGLSALCDEELPFLDADDQRLACQACVRGDVVVRLEPGA